MNLIIIPINRLNLISLLNTSSSNYNYAPILTLLRDDRKLSKYDHKIAQIYKKSIVFHGSHSQGNIIFQDKITISMTKYRIIKNNKSRCMRKRISYLFINQLLHLSLSRFCRTCSNPIICNAAQLFYFPDFCYQKHLLLSPQM